MVEWRVIEEFPDYEVSNEGQIRRAVSTVGRLGTDYPKGYILKPRVTKCYYRICLRKSRKSYHRSVHRLVAAAFIGPCPEGLEVNHKDCNKLNNNVENLEYITPKENTHHAIANGHTVSGESNPKAVLTEEDVLDIRERNFAGETCTSIARDYPITRPCVSRIVLGESWSSVGGPVRKPYKLSDEERKEIRRRAHMGETQKSMAKDFSVDQTTISRIVRAQRT